MTNICSKSTITKLERKLYSFCYYFEWAYLLTGQYPARNCMFKVNNRNTRTSCSSVNSFNSEQVNAGWVARLLVVSRLSGLYVGSLNNVWQQLSCLVTSVLKKSRTLIQRLVTADSAVNKLRFKVNKEDIRGMFYKCYY